jgi:hypothetical protein
MQDLNRVRYLMIASVILRRSKQSLGTAMCLPHGQVTISTLLWEDGAVISDGRTSLSKRDGERFIVKYLKLT